MGSGCEQKIAAPGVASEWARWVPINQAVHLADIVVEGIVSSVSGPRIETRPGDPPPDRGGADGYFRFVELVVESSERISQPSLERGVVARLLIYGAGPDVDEAELCYGPDGVQSPTEPPLAVGDTLVVLADRYEDFPLVGAEGQLILFMPQGIVDLWVVASDGSTDSHVPEFELPVDALRARLAAEIDAGPLEFDQIAQVDPLSTPPPVGDDVDRFPSTTAPPPPGSDATNSPTIPTPEGVPDPTASG